MGNQSSNERLEKDSAENTGREKLVDISFNQILSKSRRPRTETVDKSLSKKKDEGNKENLPDDDDDGAIVISSDEEEKEVEEENYEKKFEDLKRRAYQFLDQFFEENPSMLAELKAKLEMEDQQKERDLRMGMETYKWMETQRKATEEETQRRRNEAEEGKEKSLGAAGGARMYLRKCRLCGWSATSQKELDDHKSIHMQMDRTVKCLQCSLVFFDQRDLRAHEKAVHKSEFRCVYCDKEFRKAAYLEKHMIQHKMLTESHTPSPPTLKKVEEKLLAPMPSVKKTFRCKVCLKTFKKKSNWKKHNKLHL